MSWIESLAQDVRIAARMLNRSRGTTLLCILSITLGIGLTTSMFSLGDAMFLRPFPIRQPDKLLWLTSLGDDGNRILYGYADYEDMARSAGSLATLASYERVGGTLRVGDQRQFVLVYHSTPNFFEVVGVRAQLGQASLERLGGQPAVVIGNRLWQQKFASDPAIIGKTIDLNGKSLVVAGVMPAEFTGLARGVPNDVWVSTDDWFTALGHGGGRHQRDGQFEIIARLSQPGASRLAIAAQLDAAIRGPGKHKPAPGGQTGTMLVAQFAPGWKETVLGGGGVLLVLGLVLFVACANVAQLRLAQAETRKKEFGIRIAVGAGSLRVARQLVVETALVSLVGAGAGVLLARFLMRTASEFITAVVPYLDFGLRLDLRVLAFALSATVGSVFLSGLAPAQHTVKLNVTEALKSDQGATGSRAGWQRTALVVGQVAGSVLLFGLAVLFFESFQHALEVWPGFDPDKKMLVIEPQPALEISALSWCEQACERLGSLPGVRGATFARRLPLSGSGGGLTVRVEVPGRPPLGVGLNNVAGNYFSVMGTRMLAGRGIDANDRESTPPVVVLSRQLARQTFPGINPLGRWISVEGKQRQVVGIAEDAPSNNLHEDIAPFLYLPFAQMPSGDITLLVETAGDPGLLAASVRRELKRFDPGAMLGMTTLHAHMHQALVFDQLIVTVSAGLGVFGFLLTAAGLFGVIQLSVNRRTREIGLRMSLGARPSDIGWMVLGESLRTAAWGVPLGLLLLAPAAWSVRSFVFGVSPATPFMYVVSAATTVLLALSAAWLPARRATQVHPMGALRGE